MTFHRGGIDSFVMTTRRSLGELLYLRIWHDNTGKVSWWNTKGIFVGKTSRKCTINGRSECQIVSSDKYKLDEYMQM